MLAGFDGRRLAATASSYAIDLGLPAFAAGMLAVFASQAEGVDRYLAAAGALAVLAHAVIGQAKGDRAARRIRSANGAVAEASEALERTGGATLAVLEALKGEVIPSLDKTLLVASGMTADRRLSASVRGRAGSIEASNQAALAILQAFVRQPDAASHEAEPAYVAMAPLAGEMGEGAACDAEPMFPDPVSAAGRQPLEGLRVLVGESNGVHRLLLRTLLAQLGAEAEIVGDGIEVMEAWRDGRWDLILLDLQMPRMDGFAVAHMIRSVEGRFSWSPTPIVALTADNSKRVAAGCAEAGMNAWVARPIDRESLVAAIDDAFGAPAHPVLESPAQMRRAA